MTGKRIDAAEFDARFDRGEDITEFLDFSQAKRPGREPQPVDIKLPSWMLSALDSEAERLGLTRQALLNAWIAERLSS